MKVQRYYLTILVVLGLVAASGAAWGFTLENELALDRVSQVVNLRGSSTTGQINFANLLRIMPNGTEVPFAIPPGHVLIITRVYFDLKTASTATWTMLYLDPFLYPAAGGGNTFIVNDTASHARILGSGSPLGPPSPTAPPYRLRMVDPLGGDISGDLNVNILGFLLTAKDLTFVNSLLLRE